MKARSNSHAEELVEEWYHNIRSFSTLTESDCYNLKDHLLNTIDELRASGLNDEDAFEVAAMRLGQDFNFDTGYSGVNSDIILTRKILLILSGIMTYFLFYFLMNTTVRIIFFHYGSLGEDPVILARKVEFFLFGYHLFFIVLAGLIYLSGNRIINKTVNLKIVPIHIVLIVIIVFSLAFANFKLQIVIINDLPKAYLLITKYFTIFNNSSYSFPVVIAICFLALCLRINRSVSKTKTDQGRNINGEIAMSETEQQIKERFGDQLNHYKESGLDEEEAIALIIKRYRILTERDENKKNNGQETKQMETLLIAVSGLLVYLFLYYLLHASTRIFLTVLQHFKDDPVKNFSWTRWFIASFHLIVIFFTTSVYIKDSNLLEILKKFSQRPLKIYLIIMVIIFFALIDRLFSPIVGNSLENIFDLKSKFINTIQFSDLSFSFVLLMCFLVLFNKYYRDNVKLT